MTRERFIGRRSWRVVLRERVMGPLSEAKTALRPKGPMPDRRFVIFALGRSGTSLLVTLLDTHPAIRCENELLRFNRVAPLAFLDNRTRIWGDALHGFHLKFWHLTDTQRVRDPAGFLKALEDRGALFLHLKRENVAAAAISSIHAKRIRMYHHTETKTRRLKTMHLDPAELTAAIDWRLRGLERERMMLDGIARHDLSYERDLLDAETRDARLRPTFDYLGVEPHPLSTHLRKSINRPFSEFLENYDELVEVLARRNQEHWLIGA